MSASVVQHETFPLSFLLYSSFPFISFIVCLLSFLLFRSSCPPIVCRLTISQPPFLLLSSNMVVPISSPSLVIIDSSSLPMHAGSPTFETRSRVGLQSPLLRLTFMATLCPDNSNDARRLSTLRPLLQPPLPLRRGLHDVPVGVRRI